jgi:hypothetical protein
VDLVIEYDDTGSDFVAKETKSGTTDHCKNRGVFLSRLE